MSTITRRRFLARTTLGAGAALAAPFAWGGQATAVAPAKATTGADLVTLGKTGIKTSVLGLGTGTRSGREQRDLGVDGFVRLAREAFDRGIRYIDTADSYKTHPQVAAALKELPRGDIFLQTKTWAKNADQARADVDRFRRELGVETLDTLLIHCMTKPRWPVDMRPVIDVLFEAKAKGQVRAIGVSCHSFEALTESAECDAMDVHLVRINPFQNRMDDTPEKVASQLQAMHEKNRGVIGMKIYGEGDFKTRRERLDSLKYVLGLGTVQAFTIGFSTIEQIDETLALIEEATAA
jgi:predicted aldo/keto reductase-like oxidoreductase